MRDLMIVDDSSLIRTRIQNEHDKSLFNIVAEAKDGEDALEKFTEHRPQVITMDLTMPNMDGIDTIEKIVELDQDVRILVVSALNDKLTGMLALEKGAMGFINKPFTPEELCEALELIIDDE